MGGHEARYGRGTPSPYRSARAARGSRSYSFVLIPWKEGGSVDLGYSVLSGADPAKHRRLRSPLQYPNGDGAHHTGCPEPHHPSRGVTAFRNTRYQTIGDRDCAPKRGIDPGSSCTNQRRLLLLRRRDRTSAQPSKRTKEIVRENRASPSAWARSPGHERRARRSPRAQRSTTRAHPRRRRASRLSFRGVRQGGECRR